MRSTLIALLPLWLLGGCLPDAPVAPSWTAQLTVPLIDGDYSLSRLLSDVPDSALRADASTGALRLERTTRIAARQLGDELRLTALTSDLDATLGSLLLDGLTAVTARLDVGTVFPNAPVGTPVQISGQPIRLAAMPVLPPTVAEVVVDSGRMTITVSNRTPVWVRRVALAATDRAGTTFGGGGPSVLAEIADLAPRSTRTVTVDLVDAVLSRDLRVEPTLTPTAATVTFAAADAVELTFDLGPLRVQQARATFGPQRVTTGGALPFTRDSVEASYLKVASVQGRLILENTLAAAVDEATFTVPSLRLPNGQPYTLSGALPPGTVAQPSRLVLPLDGLSGAAVGSPGNGAPMLTELPYRFTYRTRAASDVALSREDYVRLRLEIDTLYAAELSGRIPPVEALAANTTGVDLTLFSRLTGVTDLLIPTVELTLRVRNDARFEAEVSGWIVGTGPGGQRTLTVPQSRIAPDGVTTVSADPAAVGALIAVLPRRLEAFGSRAVLNPDYRFGSVRAADSLTADLTLRLPLRFAATALTATDTFQVRTADLADARSGRLALLVANGLPLGATATVRFLDETGATVLTVSVAVQSGPTAPGAPVPVQPIERRFTAAEIGALGHARTGVLTVAFATADGAIVTLRTDQSVDVTAVLELDQAFGGEAN